MVEEKETNETEETNAFGEKNAEVKQLIAKGNESGFVTMDEIKKAIGEKEVSSEVLEDIMTVFSELGITIQEKSDEADDEQSEDAKDDDIGGNLATTESKSYEDPVRMYLRDMGSVELLSREGEVAIAKRIEAGKNKMIDALCESPMTMKAITEWHDQLENETILLREIIDLETMSGEEPEYLPEDDDAEDGEVDVNGENNNDDDDVEVEEMASPTKQLVKEEKEEKEEGEENS
ncbi:MAG: RNA polymerase sigma factor region1.1 domain-containing protein, partial [Alphaproteobacteria bacterium]